MELKRENPLARPSRGKRVLRALAIVTIVLGAPLAYGLWYHLFRAPACTPFADAAEHYKYGSIANKRGVPLYVWEVLPELFRDKLPGGFESLGLIVETNRTYPVGMGVRTVGYPGLSANCALCHSSRYRSSIRDTPIFVPGAPAHRFDFDRFQQFVVDCAADPRFNGPTLLAAIKKRRQLGVFEGWIYRWLLIPGLRKEVLAGQTAFAWGHTRPPAGPGRADAFNRIKFSQLGLPDDGTIGTSDFPPLWAQQKRAGLWQHWNGSGNDLAAENLLSALPTVGDPKAFDAAGFGVITNYISTLAPPAFPFPIEAALVDRGRIIFAAHCADCHAFGGKQTGQVTPAAMVGTDPEFLKMWTTGFVQKLNAIDQPPFRFGSIRVTNGYLNVPLDGCWLRAPYLHNGSVPTLWDLLQPPGARPKRFYRGSDVYDPAKLGFVSEVTGIAKPGFAYDTALPGNSNQGHEYGTALSDVEKRALIEYLKTL